MTLTSNYNAPAPVTFTISKSTNTIVINTNSYAPVYGAKFDSDNMFITGFIPKTTIEMPGVTYSSSDPLNPTDDQIKLTQANLIAMGVKLVLTAVTSSDKYANGNSMTLNDDLYEKYLNVASYNFNLVSR